MDCMTVMPTASMVYIDAVFFGDKRKQRLSRKHERKENTKRTARNGFDLIETQYTDWIYRIAQIFFSIYL